MFLNLLNKKQKNLFMELAIKAAEANGVVELSEKNMLKSFGMEMEIKPFYSSDSVLEDVLKELKSISTDTELRIILFETIGILITDNNFDSLEIAFSKKVADAFEISDDQSNEMIKLINEYSATYKKIVDTIMCKENP